MIGEEKSSPGVKNHYCLSIKQSYIDTGKPPKTDKERTSVHEIQVTLIVYKT